MSLGDVIQIRTIGSLFGQEIINVFNYEQISESLSSPSLTDLATEFLTVVVTPWMLVASSEYTQPTIEVEEIRPAGSLDVEGGLITVGGVSGECLPPFVAWSFIYRRGTRDTFNGHKRLAGVPESQQINGVATVGALALLSDLADAMASQLTVGSYDYLPCIVSKTLNGVPRDEILANLVSGVDYQRISSQNSRKFGRGA